MKRKGEMKRKIFKNMCFLAGTTLLLTSILVSIVIYGTFFNQMKHDVKDEAEMLADILDTSGTSYLLKGTGKKYINRITLIAPDGGVLFESVSDINAMDNHLDRPEIIEAISKGAGESTRVSDTLGKQNYYYAVLLENGDILRVANTINSVYSVVFSTIPYLFIIASAVFIMSIVLADWQTKRIVDPINALNLEDPISNDVYDELSTLLVRIEKQNMQIKYNMDDLHEKQEEFSAITQNMREGLIILNNGSYILSMNQSARKLFNVEEDDYLNKHILTVNRSAEMQTVVADAAGGNTGEAVLSTGGRQYQLLGSRVTAKGATRGIVLLILDITEKQAAEKMRREFSANVSHELKTPLTSILGFAEIMKDGLVKKEDVPELAGKIYAEADHLVTLIEDIIKLSRLDEGSIDLPREDVDLYLLSQDVCERLKPAADRKGVLLTVTGGSAVINGVRQILDEMIYNLCDNAIKYNNANGKAEINVSGSEQGVLLSVSDTGIGIPDKQHDRVFERFYRVDKSHSKGTGGTGLGLSIVKHGAIYHKAEVKLESEPEKGTTISILFPNKN